MTENREIRHFHLFCGLGGGALGFNRGHAHVGNIEAKFKCLNTLARQLPFSQHQMMWYYEKRYPS